MSFGDVFAAFGATPNTRFDLPVTCPICGQPAGQAHREWLQPCGHHVGDTWIRDTLTKEEPT